MKKNLFFTLILMFISLFIFNTDVNAEEIEFPLEGMGIANSSSKNLLKPGFGPSAYTGNYWYVITDTSSTSKRYPVLNNFIKVKPNTTYTFSSNLRLNFYFYEFDSSFNDIVSFQAFPSWSFTTNENCSYFLLGAYAHVTVLNDSQYWFQLEEGDVATDYVEYAENLESDPIISDFPKPQETDQSKILQNFYTLFLDRLKFISEYAINNYLFLAFIGIFLILVILEIFLYLYNRGGYK